MRFLPLLACALPAVHAFVAYSGNSCNGDKGATVACDGSCHSFGGRHSFATGLDNTCVSMWTSSGCTGQRFNFTNRFSSQCTNVNTGTDIQSFRCYRGSLGCSA